MLYCQPSALPVLAWSNSTGAPPPPVSTYHRRTPGKSAHPSNLELEGCEIDSTTLLLWCFAYLCDSVIPACFQRESRESGLDPRRIHSKVTRDLELVLVFPRVFFRRNRILHLRTRPLSPISVRSDRLSSLR